MTLPPLNATAIVDALSASATAMFAGEVYDSVGSTNDEGRAFLLADGSPLADGSRGVVALAEEQTQGRGRRGRLVLLGVHLRLGFVHGVAGRRNDVGIVGRKRVNPGEASSDSQVVVYSPSDLGVHSSSSLSRPLTSWLNSASSASNSWGLSILRLRRTDPSAGAASRRSKIDFDRAYGYSDGRGWTLLA